MHRGLVVDVDADNRRLIADFMSRFGYQIEGVESAAAMRRALATRRFDIVFLDLLIGDEDGLSLCAWVRSRAALPLISMADVDDSNTRILALEMGADDFLRKPFELRELVARANAILRRVQSRATAVGDRTVVRFADWSFDRVGRSVVSSEQLLVPLSAHECRLLEAFLGHPGTVMSRAELRRVLGGDPACGRSIDLAVGRLRKKLQGSPGLIRTIRGEGFLFNAAVVS